MNAVGMKIDSNQSVNTSSTQIDNSASIDSNAPLNRLKDLKELDEEGIKTHTIPWIEDKNN